jgi:hypothetical protein
VGEAPIVALRVERDLDAVRAELGRGTVRMEQADWTAVLRELTSLVGESRIGRQEIFWITDLQQVGWNIGDSIHFSERKMYTVPNITNVIGYLCDVGSDNIENIQLSDFRSEDRILHPGRPARFSAVISNLGTEPVSGVGIELWESGVDGAGGPGGDPGVLRLREPVERLEPGEIRSLSLRHTFWGTGPRGLTVSLTPDSLDLDNRRYLAVSLSDRFRILVINGEPHGQADQDETAALGMGLRSLGLPDGRAAGMSGGIEVETIPVYDFHDRRPIDYPAFQAVILANVASVPSGQLERLEAYVKGGGALLFFLGKQVLPQEYRERLYRGGEGLFPGPLGETVAAGGDAEESLFFGIEPLPDQRVIQGWDPQILYRISFVSRFLRLELPDEDPNLTIHARFTDRAGSPAIVERRFGRGKVLCIPTSCDREWSELPLLLPPLLRELLGYACTAERWNLLRVGEEWEGAFPLSISTEGIRLVRPDGVREGLSPRVEQGIAFARVERTDQAGLYGLEGGIPPRALRSFAANLPAEEGELHRWDPQALCGLFTPLRMKSIASMEELRRALGRGGPPGAEWWRPLVGLVVLLLGAESILASAIGRR